MTRPVTVTVRVPVEVTLVCVVRVTPGHPGTREDPPEPDEHEVMLASICGKYGEQKEIAFSVPVDAVLREWDEMIYEAASDAVARGEG